jgi:hypothetical protein
MYSDYPRRDYNLHSPDRQYDINRINNQHITLPLAIPYRLDATDYAFFNYSDDFPVDAYEVIVESADNASGNPRDRFRSIGPLSRKVELPGVFFSRGFGSASSILVLPKQEGMQKFIGNINRGATYFIDRKAQIITKEGHRALGRTGGIFT